LCGCLKSRGFCLEATYLKEPERLSRMIALCWAFRTGEWLAQQKSIPIEKHGRNCSIEIYTLESAAFSSSLVCRTLWRDRSGSLCANASLCEPCDDSASVFAACCRCATNWSICDRAGNYDRGGLVFRKSDRVGHACIQCSACRRVSWGARQSLFASGVGWGIVSSLAVLGLDEFVLAPALAHRLGQASSPIAATIQPLAWQG